MNVLWIVILIPTCYNWYYNLNSLVREQFCLKRNFSWRGAQIISSEIIQMNDKSFQKTYILDILTKMSNFRKYILRPSGAYRESKTLRKTLSLRNLKRNLSTRILNGSFKMKTLTKILEKINWFNDYISSSKTALIFWKNIAKLLTVFANFRTIGSLVISHS